MAHSISNIYQPSNTVDNVVLAVPNMDFSQTRKLDCSCGDANYIVHG